MTLPDSYFKGAVCPYCESKDTLRVNRRTWACRGCHRGWKGEVMQAERGQPGPTPGGGVVTLRRLILSVRTFLSMRLAPGYRKGDYRRAVYEADREVARNMDPTL